MKRSMLLLGAALWLAACNDGESGTMGVAGTPGAPSAAGLPGPPASMDLGAFVRAGMNEPWYAEPRDVNALELISTGNPNEFDDLF